MDEDWLPQSHEIREDQTARVLRMTVPESSPWFSGHFPGFPILPGIGQLYLAFNLIREREKKAGRNVALKEIKKVRFRKMIAPGDSITLEVAHHRINPGRYSFTITAAGTIAAQGTMIVQEKEEFAERDGDGPIT